MTMSLISTVTVGAGGAASIEFTSIPQDATDLVILISTRSSNNNSETYFTVNGVSSTTDGSKLILHSGAVGNGFDRTDIDLKSPLSTQTANTFSNGYLTIPNYAGTATKICFFEAVTENNASSAYGIIGAGTFGITAAITSILFSPILLFVQNSTVSLYKITKGSDGITVAT